VKTGNERAVPLLPEVVAVLRRVIGARSGGPVFVPERLVGRTARLVGDRQELGRVCEERQQAARSEDQPLSRAAAQKIARKMWWDAGAVKADAVRNSLIRVMQASGHPEATCPRSWRHTFATVLQDANVDPLIRQQVMGHRPAAGGGLDMTAKYTHTRPETLRQQVEHALRAWPASLLHALGRCGTSARG
jgi:integrase